MFSERHAPCALKIGTSFCRISKHTACTSSNLSLYYGVQRVSISDDVHQTVVNSGIGTTYRSGTLEFTSLFSVVRFTQFFIAWMVRCDKIFSAKTVISSLTLWLSNYSFVGLPQSHSLTAFVWFLVWTFFSLVMHECCWNSSHQC